MTARQYNVVSASPTTNVGRCRTGLNQYYPCLLIGWKSSAVLPRKWLVYSVIQVAPPTWSTSSCDTSLTSHVFQLFFFYILHLKTDLTLLTSPSKRECFVMVWMTVIMFPLKEQAKDKYLVCKGLAILIIINHTYMMCDRWKYQRSSCAGKHLKRCQKMLFPDLLDLSRNICMTYCCCHAIKLDYHCNILSILN